MWAVAMLGISLMAVTAERPVIAFRKTESTQFIEKGRRPKPIFAFLSSAAVDVIEAQKLVMILAAANTRKPTVAIGGQNLLTQIVPINRIVSPYVVCDAFLASPKQPVSGYFGLVNAKKFRSERINIAAFCASPLLRLHRH
jgi:hypothetical protein